MIIICVENIQNPVHRPLLLLTDENFRTLYKMEITLYGMLFHHYSALVQTHQNHVKLVLKDGKRTLHPLEEILGVSRSNSYSSRRGSSSSSSRDARGRTWTRITVANVSVLLAYGIHHLPWPVPHDTNELRWSNLHDEPGEPRTCHLQSSSKKRVPSRTVEKQPVFGWSTKVECGWDL